MRYGAEAERGDQDGEDDGGDGVEGCGEGEDGDGDGEAELYSIRADIKLGGSLEGVYIYQHQQRILAVICRSIVGSTSFRPAGCAGAPQLAGHGRLIRRAGASLGAGFLVRGARTGRRSTNGGGGRPRAGQDRVGGISNVRARARTGVVTVN